MSTISNRYKDLDLSFRVSPTSGDLFTKLDIEAVKASVRNLVLTGFGERPFKPKVGSAIYFSLFEPLTPISKLEIKRSIKDVINNFEPRAVLIDTLVREPESSPNSLEVEIIFYVTNIQEPQSVRISLERIR